MENEQLEGFDEQIGMKIDPVAEAKKDLKAYQEMMGIVIDNPDAPVAPDEKARAWMADEEIPGTFMNQ